MSAALPARSLGGLRVSALGMGCMGITTYYGPTNEAEALATLNQALDAGITLFATADTFGPFTNEEWLGRALGRRRNAVQVATAFGDFFGRSGRPEAVTASCDASLRRLGMDRIDLYFQFRVDPEVPLEETWGAMARLVEAGKARYLGLCEVRAETLRRAHIVHPVAAVQAEYSLWTRDPETDGVLAAARELGVGLIASSPLGRGFLAGSVRLNENLAPDDSRRNNPRFQPDAMRRNLRLVEALDLVAVQAGRSPAEVALAWLLAQGDDVVPIPGVRSRAHLRQNLQAVTASLKAEAHDHLSAAFRPEAVAGYRYSNMAFTRG